MNTSGEFSYDGSYEEVGSIVSCDENNNINGEYDNELSFHDCG
jgi:hypothetical protein